MKESNRKTDNQEFLDYLFQKMTEENKVPSKSKKDIAKGIIEQLESDDELMKEFNVLLRKKKIAKMKKNERR